jgi:hypothetical protein
LIAQARRLPQSDPDVEGRIADLELKLATAREAKRRHVRAATPPHAAPRETTRQRPTPEELGYYTTDDSFTKIIDDAIEQVAVLDKHGNYMAAFKKLWSKGRQ